MLLETKIALLADYPSNCTKQFYSLYNLTCAGRKIETATGPYLTAITALLFIHSHVSNPFTLRAAETGPTILMIFFLKKCFGKIFEREMLIRS